MSEDPNATRLRPPASGPGGRDEGSDATRIRPGRAGTDETRARAGADETRVRGSSAVSNARSAERGVTADSAVPEPGLVLQGHYRLENLIGQGAMGQVWRARDLLSEEAGERDALVAVKLFVSDFARDPNALALMQRETSRAQRLAHPNIVNVHVFDRDERTGILFMVMELVDGQPLEQLLRERGAGELERKATVPLIRGIAEGLAYAHSQGIVHCDLKPGNILVTRAGIPKILDFGIAQAVHLADAESPTSETHVLQPSLISGYTAAYASPEAIAGEPAHPADDVFALGLVAYEIVEGRHPFRREPADTARQKGLKPRRLTQLRRHEWAAVSRALEFERSKRWQSSAQFAKAFAGKSQVHKALAAAIAVIVPVTALLGYRYYVASGPAVPLEKLPAALQSEIRKSLGAGNDALDYVTRTHDFGPLWDAADAFDHAYALHPRDRDAVRGLDTTARLAVQWAEQTAAGGGPAVEELRKLTARTAESHYYEHNPVLEAEIDKLSRTAR